MTTVRKITFVNNYFYHVFNRGLDKRPTFTTKKQFIRARELLRFYQFTSLPIRFSQFNNLSQEKQNDLWSFIIKQKREVEIVAYCFMPNHFHFLLKQTNDNGISSFVANFTNAYTKYFNQVQQRTGSLFQGVFKAVYVESDEQLVHLSRYIHLNPLISSIVNQENLKTYQWSSYPEYTAISEESITQKEPVLSKFSNSSAYEKFISDQIDYAKELDKIKHMILE